MASILKVDKIRGTGQDSDIMSFDGSGNITIPKNVTFNGTGGGTKILLSDVNVSSAVASVEFVHGTGGVIFDSTYSRYELTVDRAVPSTNSERLELLISTNAGSSYFGDSQYNLVVKRFYTNGSDTADDVAYYNDFIATHRQTSHNNANRGGANGTVLISSMGQVNRTVAYGNFWGFGQSYYIHSHTVGAVESNGDDMTGVKWQFGSGNISSGRFKLYGIK